MNLEDVFKDYTKYTGSTEEYSSSDFARKLKRTFEYYNLDEYLNLISPKNKKPFDIESKYTFTDEEKKLIGLLIGVTTSSSTTNKERYPDRSILNPFLHSNHRKSLGITEMKSYTDHFINQKTEYNLSTEANKEIDNISKLIDFAFELKDCLKRLIIAIFYMKNFNEMTFERILSRLNGFIDELHLFGELHEASSSIYSALHEIECFRSIDVLIAANVGDHIYHSKQSDQPSDINISDASTETLGKLISDIDFRKEYLEKLRKKPQYISLFRFLPQCKTSSHFKKDYREYIKQTIHEMYKTYTSLLKENSTEEKIFNTFLEKFGCNIFESSSIESLIFHTYIEPDFEKCADPDKAAQETCKKIDALLANALEKANILTSENEEIDDALDKVLFKPFVRFHDNDLQQLKDKAKRNSDSLQFNK